MKVHEVKTWPLYFTLADKGIKKFEIRENDRDYKAGDVLISKEFCPEKKEYTGREMRGSIEYVTDFGQKPGWCVFGVRYECEN